MANKVYRLLKPNSKIIKSKEKTEEETKAKFHKIENNRKDAEYLVIEHYNKENVKAIFSDNELKAYRIEAEAQKVTIEEYVVYVNLNKLEYTSDEEEIDEEQPVEEVI